MDLITKVCTSCKSELLLNSDNFYKKGKSFESKCIKCKLEYSKRPDVIERRKKMVMDRYHKNPKKYNDIKKEWILKNKLRHKETQSIKDKRYISEMKESYIIQLMCNYFKISRSEAKSNKELFELYKANLNLKRICNQLKTSTN